MYASLCLSNYERFSTTLGQQSGGFFCLSGGLTSLPVLSGSKDTVSPEEDRPVLGHLGLCQTYLPEGRCGCFLQGLHPQHAGHHPLRWHRPGRLWGAWSLSRGNSVVYCCLARSDSFALLYSVRLWRIPGCSALPQTALIRECLCSWLVAPLPAHVASCPATHSPWSGLECRHKVSRCTISEPIGSATANVSGLLVFQAKTSTSLLTVWLVTWDTRMELRDDDMTGLFTFQLTSLNSYMHMNAFAFVKKHAVNCNLRDRAVILVFFFFNMFV